MDYTDEEFDKEFNALPEDVREAMTAVNTVNIMVEIKTKYNLHVDQLKELSTETGMLMLGATHPQEFIGKIEAALHIPNENAKQIAAEINEKIFRPVRESLMQIHEMGEEKSIQPIIESMPAIAEEIPEPKKEPELPVSIPKKTAPDPYREAV